MKKVTRCLATLADIGNQLKSEKSARTRNIDLSTLCVQREKRNITIVGRNVY